MQHLKVSFGISIKFLYCWLVMFTLPGFRIRQLQVFNTAYVII